MLSKSSDITEWVTFLNKRKKVSQNLTLEGLIKSKDINSKTDKVGPFSNINPRCSRTLG